MTRLTLTRFNKETWEENKEWRKKNNHNGAIYGSPIRIAASIPLDSNLFVLEMNNSIKKIEGIGYIKNNPLDKRKNIYSIKNFNRYTYKSNFRIDQRDLNSDEKNIIFALELMIFHSWKGVDKNNIAVKARFPKEIKYMHSARGTGITSIPYWIANNRRYDFVKIIKTMFESRWKENNFTS